MNQSDSLTKPVRGPWNTCRGNIRNRIPVGREHGGPARSAENVGRRSASKLKSISRRWPAECRFFDRREIVVSSLSRWPPRFSPSFHHVSRRRNFPGGKATLPPPGCRSVPFSFPGICTSHALERETDEKRGGAGLRDGLAKKESLIRARQRRVISLLRTRIQEGGIKPWPDIRITRQPRDVLRKPYRR